MALTASRLAERFAEDQGYARGTVEEAAALATACDFILTRSDGQTFSIVCIVDAATADEAQFSCDKATAKALLAECCKRYSATRQPAVLVVVEVRMKTSPEDLARLRGYSNRFFDQNAIHAFVVNPTARTVVTATKYSFLGGFGWRRFLRREIAAPS